jgi:hypothetical protein
VEHQSFCNQQIKTKIRGLAINVLYTLDDKKKRAVGFKLSEGMEIP